MIHCALMGDKHIYKYIDILSKYAGCSLKWKNKGINCYAEFRCILYMYTCDI